MAEKVLTENEKMTEKAVEKKSTSAIVAEDKNNSTEIEGFVSFDRSVKDQDEDDVDNGVDVSHRGTEKMFTLPWCDVKLDLRDTGGIVYHNFYVDCAFKTGKKNPDGSPKMMHTKFYLVLKDRKSALLYEHCDLIFDGRTSTPITIVKTERYDRRSGKYMPEYSCCILGEDELVGQIRVDLQPSKGGDAGLFENFKNAAIKRGWID